MKVRHKVSFITIVPSRTSAIFLERLPSERTWTKRVLHGRCVTGFAVAGKGTATV